MKFLRCHLASRALIGACVVAGAIGCGGRETLEVSGGVTFDGKPVERGEISFVPTAGGAPDGGVIEQGKFQFQARPGSKRVEIRGSRPVPPARQSNSEMGPMYEDYIPARYNDQSTLTADVTADGDRHFQFDLRSTPP
jgi:hypothetical protein